MIKMEMLYLVQKTYTVDQAKICFHDILMRFKKNVMLKDLGKKKFLKDPCPRKEIFEINYKSIPK